MKILVTGANGLLGQHLVKSLLEKTVHHIIATGKGSSRIPFIENERYTYCALDITDGIAVNNFLLDCRPDIVVHAAAMTQVDECEVHPVECWNLNVTATRFLIDACKEIKSFFIFISTDFVFDGDKGMYDETAITAPANYYGSSKVAAEKAVEASGLDFAIARTCLVYGSVLSGNRSNIISWVKENLAAQKPIRVVSDQWRTPTYVEDLANGIILIIEKKAKGIYHLSGEEVMTPYNMAVAVAQYCKLDKQFLSETNAINFTQPAKRPVRTGFIIDKAKKELSFAPVKFAEALQKIFGSI
ncbi:MAG: SDR family oxidoreductase [Ferruginibacter sp.]